MAKRSGGFPSGGMNMQSMMQQAQKMQASMAKMQEELEEREVEAAAGGGVVKVATGKKNIKSITIAPEVVDPDDIEMLEDLITAAVNEAMNMAEEMVQTEMGKITGGMNLGGLF